MEQLKIKKPGKFFVIFITILAIGVIFTMADLFSSLITVGGFTFTNNGISQQQYTLYAVCTNVSQNKTQASESSNTCKIQGGAGYVYLFNQQYYVIASIYENESDAEKVLTNIKQENMNATKIAITIPGIKLSCNLNSEEKEVLNKSINIFKTTYQELYDLAISLDTALISEVNAKLSVNTVGSKINTIYSNFNTLFNNQMNNNFIMLKIKLSELFEKINNLINSPTTYSYSGQLKQAYCETIFIYKSLSDGLQ